MAMVRSLTSDSAGVGRGGPAIEARIVHVDDKVCQNTLLTRDLPPMERSTLRERDDVSP